MSIEVCNAPIAIPERLGFAKRYPFEELGVGHGYFKIAVFSQQEAKEQASKIRSAAAGRARTKSGEGESYAIWCGDMAGNRIMTSAVGQTTSSYVYCARRK